MTTNQDSPIRRSQQIRPPSNEATSKSSQYPHPSPKQWQSAFTSYAHTVCRRCNHWVDGKECSIFPDQDRHFSLSCDNCNTKLLRLCRRSTQLSFVSQLTTSACSRRQSEVVICTAAEDGIAEGIAGAPPTSHLRQSTVTSAEVPAARDESTPLPQEANVTASPTSVLRRNSLTNFPRSQPVPHRSLTQPPSNQARGTRCQPKPKRRVKVLQAVMDRISTMLGSDVKVQVIQKSLSRSEQIEDNLAALSPVATRSSPSKRSYVPSARLSDLQQSREQLGTGNNITSNPPQSLDIHTLKNIDHFDDDEDANEDFDDADPAGKKNPQRLKKYKSIRQERTKAHNVGVCHCQGTDCPCMTFQPRADGAASLLNHTPTNRSVSALARSSRSTTEQSAASSPLSTIFRGIGGRFRHIQRPRDSGASSTSGPVWCSRASISRPSRINSIQSYEPASSTTGTRGGSEVARTQVITATWSQDGMRNGWSPTQRRHSSDHSNTAPSTNRTVEEPEQRNHIQDRPQSLRVDTDTAFLTISNLRSNPEMDSGSHGNSSTTITPTGRSQWDNVRGTREGWEGDKLH